MRRPSPTEQTRDNKISVSRGDRFVLAVDNDDVRAPDLERARVTDVSEVRASRPGRTALWFVVELPVVDGLAIAGQLRGHGCGTKVVVLSALDKPAVVRAALSNSVQAFLPKGVSIDKLVETVRRVHDGETVIGAELISAALSGELNPLTSREREVLTLLAGGETAKEVSRELHIAVGTVSNTVTRILQKLRARNKVDAIRIAKENGWI